VIFTVIGPDGAIVANNQIGHSPPNTEGGGPEGQLGMDMAPAQPHTAGREARKCESCHSNPKALGYGIDAGRYLLGYEEDRVVDLRDADGNLIPSNYSIQMAGIPDLNFDLSRIVDPETGEQTMTVGSHWPASGPLTADQRERMERTGVCMGCHTNMADTAFWTDQVIAQYGKVVSNVEHIATVNQLVHDAVAEKDPVIEVEMDQAQIQSLEVDLAAAQALLSDTEFNLDEAESAITEAESVQAEAQAAGVPLSNMMSFVIIALAVGLVIGVSVMFVFRKI
jgi:hypothetical protein